VELRLWSGDGDGAWLLTLPSLSVYSVLGQGSVKVSNDLVHHHQEENTSLDELCLQQTMQRTAGFTIDSWEPVKSLGKSEAPGSQKFLGYMDPSCMGIQPYTRPQESSSWVDAGGIDEVHHHRRLLL